MKKIIARYYYAPICPEAFATIDKLGNLFSQFGDSIEFIVVDFSKEMIVLNNIQFAKERNFINRIHTGEEALLYGKLFIEGELINGFPPSAKFIKENLLKHGLPLEKFYYEVKYQKINRTKIDCKKDKLVSKSVCKKNGIDVCLLCTKNNRFLDENEYDNEHWNKFENQKLKHLLTGIKDKNSIAIIEYYNGNPVGFIEGYTLKESRKYGFPTNRRNNGYMITCLHIKEEVSGNGIAKKLITRFEQEVIKKGFESVQVLAFPDMANWQPIGMYEKSGYSMEKKIGDMALMVKGTLKE
ncbi:MAG: GNAT family N-acetyltransferase [bacterium]|nr:GNAT family N-acetyltransferase [bacterium]